MFEEAHESPEGLRRVFAGETSSVEAERVVAHLTGCRECWLLATRAIAAQKERGGIVVQGTLRPLIDLYEMEQARLEEWLGAQALWVEIRSLTPKARRDKVRLTRTLHTSSFLEVLFEAGVSAPPAEGEELFYLALLVAQQLSSPRVSVELRNDLCAECCAEIANARRRQAKWPAVRDALKKGMEYVEKGSRNGVVEAKVLCVEAALEDDLGSSEEAAAILRRTVGLFESAGQTFLIGRTLAQLANSVADYDPGESLQAIAKALALIQGSNPRLVAYLEILRMNCLVTMGAPQEALIRLNERKGLYEQFREPYIQLRKQYTAARILENLGEPKRAEILMQEVIAGDLENGLVKDLFLDLVYLFGFHLRKGQSSEAIAVCRRASQELSLLDDEEGSTKIAREQMRMVWQKLEEEVRKGNVELGATDVLRKYVRSHWRFPADDPPFLDDSAST
jgi:tetratricopeptide (TPR) repeat protein